MIYFVRNTAIGIGAEVEHDTLILEMILWTFGLEITEMNLSHSSSSEAIRKQTINYLSMP